VDSAGHVSGGIQLEPTALAAATLIVLEGSKAFRELVPPIAEVRRADPTDADFRVAFRSGELLASAIILLGAGSVAAMSQSGAPLVLAAAALGTYLAVYETAYAAAPPVPLAGLRVALAGAAGSL
jgi:hypothetical protein